MRVYLPLTLPALARLHQARVAGPAPLTAYAVTPGLREWALAESEEEWEYAALGRAAEASLRLLAADSQAPRLRVVLAADVPASEAALTPGDAVEPGTLGQVRLTATVPLAKAAAIHLDGADARSDVADAVSALPAADRGDPQGRHTVDSAAHHELLWYGLQELDGLLASLRGDLG